MMRKIIKNYTSHNLKDVKFSKSNDFVCTSCVIGKLILWFSPLKINTKVYVITWRERPWMAAPATAGVAVRQAHPQCRTVTPVHHAPPGGRHTSIKARERMNKGLQDSITSFSLQLLSQQFLPYALNGLEADAVLIPEDAYVSILPQAPHDQQEQGVCSFALVHWQACSEAAPCVEDVQIIADAKTLWHSYEAQSLPPNVSLNLVCLVYV
jgi:hypothetical protein